MGFVPDAVYESARESIVAGQRRDSYRRAVEMLTQAKADEPKAEGQLGKMYKVVILNSKNPTLINQYGIREFAQWVNGLSEEGAFCKDFKNPLMMGEVSKFLVKALR